MCKWFFMALLICVVASDENSIIFGPHTTTLTNCIQHHLGNINEQFKLTRIAKVAADLTARRFRGKSILNKNFNKRFYNFFYQLRSDKINHKMCQNDLSGQLYDALKQALLLCAVSDTSFKDSKILGMEKSKELLIQEKEWISFNPDKKFLYDCIEKHLKLTGFPEFNEDDEFTAFIADYTAKRHYGKSFSRTSFHKSTWNLFYNLRTKKIPHNFSVDKLSSELELVVRQSVEDCALNRVPLATLPTFKTEPSEVDKLLNLILVKWPNNLHFLIQSRKGRNLLRRFANDALASLIRVLSIFQNKSQIFRLALRSFWKSRAQEMYDAYCVDLPYIVHRYTLNYPAPHMIQSEFKKFVNRSNKSFRDRNPFVPRSYLNKILNVHKPDHDEIQGGEDIFDNYSHNGMTYAEYYFEHQINQFYRILFLFLEFRARGMSTDRNDFYEGALPYYWVPEKIQAIILDDDAYRDYLLDERHFYEIILGNNTQNNIAQDLIGNARTLEENLILLRLNTPSTSDIELNGETSSTTTLGTTSMTTESSKRKDSVWKNENGKCFPFKRAKSTTFSEDINDNPVMESVNNITNSSVSKNHNYFLNDFIDELSTLNFECFTLQVQNEIEKSENFGYMAFGDDSNQMQFTFEDLLLLEESPHFVLFNDEHC